MKVLLVPRKFTELATRLLEIALYIGTAVAMILAIQSPAEHASFLSQNFEMWMFAEFMAIVSVGMLSARVRQRIPLLAASPLFISCAVLFLVPWLVYGQLALTLFMFAALILRVIKIELSPSTLGPDLAVRAFVFLVTILTIPRAIEGMGILFPEFMATSDPFHMLFLPKFGGMVWVIEYYTLLVLASLWLLYVDRHPRLVYDHK